MQGIQTSIDSVWLLGSPALEITEFPNVFTPHEDETNDILNWDNYFSECQEYQFLMTIRRGNVAFEKRNGTTPFNSKDQFENQLSDGVYF